MLDLANLTDAPGWDQFRPVGEDTFQQELFETWWERQAQTLGHLHAEICEQWIYRHWRGTRHRWLDPLDLTWRLEGFDTDRFLSLVHLHWGGPADPAHDYEVFRPDRPDPLETALNWENGTWTLPPILLETPEGIRFHAEKYPNVRFLVVEGSKRYRWLNALAHRCAPTGPHQAYVLSQRVQVNEG